MRQVPIFAMILLIAGCNCCRPREKAAPVSPPPPPHAPATQSTWRDMFDGKSLAGWRQSGYGGEFQASVENGILMLPAGERLSGITSTRNDLPETNYEVELEARRVEGTD